MEQASVTQPIVFIDTNVVIDLLAGREPFWHTAATIFNLAEREEIKAYTNGLTLVTVYFVLNNYYKVAHRDIIQKLALLCSFIQIAGLTSNQIARALQSDFSDFEDAVMYYSAADIPGLTDIVTRNTKHFLNTSVAVCSPDEFLTKYNF